MITSRSTRHAQRGFSFIAFVVYLFSLMWVGWIAFAAALAVLALGETTLYVVLAGVAFLAVIGAWTWLFFRIVRKRRARELAGIHEGSSAEARVKERRRDNARMFTSMLAWPLTAAFGFSVLVSIAWSIDSLIRKLLPAMPAYFGIALSVLFLVTGMILFGKWMMRRTTIKRSTGRMVLWLRRFHQPDLFPFDLFLEDVTRGIALPVTVQDTTVNTSLNAANTSMRTVWAQILAMGSFIGLGAALVLLEEKVLILLIGGPLVLGCQVLAYWVLKRGGANDLRTRSGKQRLEELMAKLDGDDDIPNTLTLFRMDDAHWKEWVGGFIKRADAVVMDVTHLTESLGWELDNCRQHLHSSRMILALGRAKEDEADPWPEVQAQLEAMLDAEWVAGCQRFTYERPRKIPLLQRIASGWEQRRAIKARKRYEKEFLDMLDVAFAAEKPGI